METETKKTSKGRPKGSKKCSRCKRITPQDRFQIVNGIVICNECLALEEDKNIEDSFTPSPVIGTNLGVCFSCKESFNLTDLTVVKGKKYCSKCLENLKNQKTIPSKEENLKKVENVKNTSIPQNSDEDTKRLTEVKEDNKKTIEVECNTNKQESANKITKKEKERQDKLKEEEIKSSFEKLLDDSGTIQRSWGKHKCCTCNLYYKDVTKVGSKNYCKNCYPIVGILKEKELNINKQINEFLDVLTNGRNDEIPFLRKQIGWILKDNAKWTLENILETLKYAYDINRGGMFYTYKAGIYNAIIRFYPIALEEKKNKERLLSIPKKTSVKKELITVKRSKIESSNQFYHEKMKDLLYGPKIDLNLIDDD